MFASGVASADDVTPRPALATHGWLVGISGYVQVDATPYDQESVDELDPVTRAPLNREHFLVRRGVIRAETHKDLPEDHGAIGGSVELEGTGTALKLETAEATWSYPRTQKPLVSVSAGLQRIPFGADVQVYNRDKTFLESPAFVRALFPGNFDAGVVARGEYGMARWSVGLMNGAPAGDAQWHGVDPTSSYELIARAGFVVDGPRRWRFEGGVSALTGTGLHPGKAPTKDEIQWVDNNGNGIVELPELQVLPGSPGEPSQTYKHSAIGADFAAHWCLCGLGNGWAFFEMALATNLDRGLVYADPIDAGRNLRQLGYTFGVVQDLGDRAQVGVRYDRYDADRDAFEPQGFDIVNVHKIFSTLGVMGAVRYKGARLLVQYNLERNPFGRGDDGQPITRRADALTFRAQVGF